MGIALWVVTGLVVFGATRGVSIGRTRWQRELVAAVAATLTLGLVATRLDFGGWNEPDGRAGLFAGFGALTAIAAARLMSSTRPPVSDSASQNRPKR